MSNTVHIVLNSCLSLILLGFIGWLCWRSLQKHHNPAILIFKWVFTAVLGWLEFAIAVPAFARGGLEAIFVGLGLTCVLAMAFNLTWRHSIIEILAKPLTNALDGGSEPPESKPYYSIAMASRKRGHPLEAIVAIREQLAKFPTDFEGVMLLANIQVEDLKDLPGAEITLNRFCASPKAPDRQVVAALTQLADWHLKQAVDVDAARAALQQIIARFPETEYSLRAEQRLAHLGETGKILLAQHDRQAMNVPEGVQNIGLLDSTAFLQPQAIEPGKLAAVYVKHLEQHPHDTEVREKLALIYAQDFKRLDLATLELAQLINEPRHMPKQVAHWLNLLANFQIELGADVATVRATLEKIAEQFPGLPVAEIAQRRLGRLNAEFKGRQPTPDVKLGVYEQNLGLKYGRPGRP